MLLEYSFENFCSFKDSAYFSLRATEGNIQKQFPLNCVEHTLKTAVIVGENAGGKTNFVKSLSFLKSLFRENNSIKTKLKFINDSYINGQETKIGDTTQKFFISVLIDDAEYNYKLELDYLGLKHEEFYIRTANQEEITKIFVLNRQEEHISSEDTIKMTLLKHRPDLPLFTLKYDLQKNPSVIYDEITKTLDQLSAKSESNSLYISKYALLEVKPAVIFNKWINDTLFVNVSSDGENYFQGKKLTDEDELILEDKEAFLPILQMADSSIENFNVDLKSPFTNTTIIRKTKNGMTSEHMLLEDSAGIRDYFPLAIQIYKVLYENKVVIVDEMDRSLNPVLSDKIVAFINGNNHKGQFIFTTHNVLHLDLNIYMKEQIYFVTKNLESLNSEMYSLSDFPDVSYDEQEPIYNFYLRGILGGVTFG